MWCLSMELFWKNLRLLLTLGKVKFKVKAEGEKHICIIPAKTPANIYKFNCTGSMRYAEYEVVPVKVWRTH